MKLWIPLTLVGIAAAATVAIGVNVPVPYLAGLLGARPEGYDPSADNLLRYRAGLGCYPHDETRENHLLDEAIAKSGGIAALRYADWMEREALREASEGDAGRDTLEGKARAIARTPMFSRERRARIGEWEAARRHLAEGGEIEPIYMRPMDTVLNKQLRNTFKALECPKAADRIRTRVRHVETAERLTRLKGALARYFDDLGAFPSADDGGGLRALIARPDGLDAGAAWQGPYAKDDDMVDGWGRALHYTDLSRGQRYTLVSTGGDGEAGGQWDRTDLETTGVGSGLASAKPEAPAAETTP